VSSAAQLSITAETIIAWRPLRLNRVLSAPRELREHPPHVCLFTESSIYASDTDVGGWLAHVLGAEATDDLAPFACLRNGRKMAKPVRTLAPCVGLCAFASRAVRPGERRTRTRVTAADPATRIGGAA